MGGVNPTDMQVTVTHSVDVAKKYSDESYKGVVGQQNLAKEDKKITEETTKKVYDKNSSQKIYKDEEQEKGRQEEQSKKDEDENEEEEAEVKVYHVFNKDGHFDVTI